MDNYILIAIACQSGICGGLAWNVALKKGQNAAAWAMVGFVFGVFGLIATVGLPNLEFEDQDEEFHKKCPDCAERIKIEALVCRYCGKRFLEGQVISTLTGILNEGTHQDRIFALNTLSHMENIDLVPHLKVLLNELNPNYDDGSNTAGEKTLFLDALDVISRSQSPQLARELTEIAKWSKSRWKTIELIERMGMLSQPAVIPTLIDFTLDPDTENSATAAILLYGEQALPELRRRNSVGADRDKRIYGKLIRKIEKDTKSH